MSDTITYQSYWAEIADLAESIVTETRDELEDGGDLAEALNERLWETVDGHQWVIYTGYHYEVLALSPNDGYSAENFGVESLVKDGEPNTAAMAFGAIYADVQEHSVYSDAMEAAYA